MKVVLVNGSPHEKGCTYATLKEIEKVLGENGVESEIFWVKNKPISGCLACNTCRNGLGKCVISDSVNEFIELAKDADGFIFGSPVHYAAPSGQITAFMDRAFYSNSKVMMGKPGAAVVCCRRGGASAAFDVLNKYFFINRMPVVSSQYWNQVHGNSPEEVLENERDMLTVRTLAANMAWLLKCIEAGKEKGITLPEV